MPKLRHIAIATNDPKATAEFYKKAFGFEQIGETSPTSPLAQGYFLSDGTLNIAILKFKTDQIGKGMDYTGVHHFGVLVDDPATGSARRRMLHGQREGPRQRLLRDQVQGPRRHRVRHRRPSLDGKQTARRVIGRSGGVIERCGGKRLGHEMKRAIFALAMLSAFGSFQAAMAEDAYPSRLIKLIVPFAAGGNTDVVGRVSADIAAVAQASLESNLPIREAKRDVLQHRLWIQKHGLTANPAELDTALAAIERARDRLAEQLAELDKAGSDLAQATEAANEAARREPPTLRRQQDS